MDHPEGLVYEDALVVGPAVAQRMTDPPKLRFLRWSTIEIENAADSTHS
jgi:hypothetical protein